MKRALCCLALVALLAASGCKKDPADAQSVAKAPSDSGGSLKGDFGPPQGPEIKAVLTSPPMVPPATGRTAPAKVIVELDVVEKEMQISEGVSYTFWTFGGTVPGSFIRVRQGDTVEFHLRNMPDSKMPHNIDLHGVTGPGGGAASSFTAPGHSSRFTFKALNAGLFVYHCATAPVGMHVANGMYGLILIEPPAGLPPVDKEYYVMQGDFYTTGKYREKGLQGFDMQKGIDEKPTYVLFNGSEGSITGDKALTAKVGESVRLYVGNGGPNLGSSFHVIGEIFDKVWYEGGTNFQENVQTTLIPSGGAAMMEFHLEVPGSYVIVDHSIFRAFNKGALAIIKATGPENPAIYSGKEVDAMYIGDRAQPSLAAVSTAAAAAKTGNLTQQEQIDAGKALFTGTCSTCHQPNGEGMAGVFPPLSADYARLPGGVFRTALKYEDSKAGVRIAPFEMMRAPVTNAQFLAFVQAQPQWRRDRVARVFADGRYLTQWRTPTALADVAQARQPVTRVSWFAAQAYCDAQKARLPTWSEWEYAAAADKTRRDARNDPAWRERILSWYSRPSSQALPRAGLQVANAYGVRDLHGLVWEWTDDFSSLLVSGDNRNQGDADKGKFCGAGALSMDDRENYAVLMRVAMLSSLEAVDTTRNLGFRCARGSR